MVIAGASEPSEYRFYPFPPPTSFFSHPTPPPPPPLPPARPRNNYSNSYRTSLFSGSDKAEASEGRMQTVVRWQFVKEGKKNNENLQQRSGQWQRKEMT